jgi:uridine phosphorylase
MLALNSGGRMAKGFAVGVAELQKIGMTRIVRTGTLVTDL